MTSEAQTDNASEIGETVDPVLEFLGGELAERLAHMQMGELSLSDSGLLQIWQKLFHFVIFRQFKRRSFVCAFFCSANCHALRKQDRFTYYSFCCILVDQFLMPQQIQTIRTMSTPQ